MVEDARTGATPIRDPQKTATSLDVQTVLRVLGPHDRLREVVMREFRRLGGDLNQFSRRAHREFMCEAITHAEDEIEFVRGRYVPADSPDRVAAKEVRRMLESELWP